MDKSRLAESTELWVCCDLPNEPLPERALALSFLRADQEAMLEQRCGARYVSGRVLAQEVRQDARQHYLDLVARIGATPIGGQTFRQALQGPGGVSRWWFLKTTEKDCVWDADITYTSLIRLLCVRRLAAKHGLNRVRIVGGTPEFAEVLATTFQVAGCATAMPGSQVLKSIATVVTGLMKRVACALFYGRLCWMHRNSPARAHDHSDVLLQAHAGWSLKPRPDGTVEDRYFGDLPGRLKEAGLRVRWLAWCEPDAAVRSGAIRKVIAELQSDDSVIMLERFLQPRDIVGRMLDLRGLTVFLRFSRRGEFRTLFHVEGYDLFPLLRGQLLGLFSGSSIGRLELLALVTERACREQRPKVVLTFLELFLHARAIYAGARRGMPDIRIWSAQHASYSSDKTFGSVRPALELRGEPDGFAVPAPDGIFAMGELARRLWLTSGFRDEQLLVTGGLRYQTIRIEQRPAQITHDRPTVLLIAGMNEALDIDMCAAVAEAARDMPVRLRLRDHPFYRLSACPAFLPFKSAFELAATTAEDDLEQADVVLFTHSGMAEEAFLKGIPTWQWLWAGFNTSVFVDLHVIPTFTSIAALRDGLREFLADPDRCRPSRDAQELILRQCFGPDPAQASQRICAKVVELASRAA